MRDSTSYTKEQWVHDLYVELGNCLVGEYGGFTFSAEFESLLNEAEEVFSACSETETIEEMAPEVPDELISRWAALRVTPVWLPELL